MGPVLYTCTINDKFDKYGACKKTIFEKLKVHSQILSHGCGVRSAFERSQRLRKVGLSIPSRERPKSFKQVVIAP